MDCFVPVWMNSVLSEQLAYLVSRQLLIIASELHLHSRLALPLLYIYCTSSEGVCHIRRVAAIRLSSHCATNSQDNRVILAQPNIRTLFSPAQKELEGFWSAVLRGTGFLVEDSAAHRTEVHLCNIPIAFFFNELYTTWGCLSSTVHLFHSLSSTIANTFIVGMRK